MKSFFVLLLSSLMLLTVESYGQYVLKNTPQLVGGGTFGVSYTDWTVKYLNGAGGELEFNDPILNDLTSQATHWSYSKVFRGFLNYKKNNLALGLVLGVRENEFYSKYFNEETISHSSNHSLSLLFDLSYDVYHKKLIYAPVLRLGTYLEEGIHGGNFHGALGIKASRPFSHFTIFAQPALEFIKVTIDNRIQDNGISFLVEAGISYNFLPFLKEIIRTGKGMAPNRTIYIGN
jgi:hypothetical protein